MASFRLIRSQAMRGMAIASILGLCAPLPAQQERGEREGERRGRAQTDQQQDNVRLPLELDKGKSYTFFVTKFSNGQSDAYRHPDRARDRSSAGQDPGAESETDRRAGKGKSDTAGQESKTAGGRTEGDRDQERYIYRFEAKQSSAGKQTVKVTISEANTFEPGAGQGATTEERSSAQESRQEAQRGREGEREERSARTTRTAGTAGTYTIVVGKNGEIQSDASDASSEEEGAMPEMAKKYIALIVGQGLHEKPLKAGEICKDGPFSSKRAGTIGTPRDRPEKRSEASKSHAQVGKGAAHRAAGSMDPAAFEQLAVLFRGVAERDGKKVARFDIVERDDRGSVSPKLSSQTEKESEEAAGERRDRGESDLKRGTFQQHRDVGEATYNLEDGLLEHLIASFGSPESTLDRSRGETSRRGAVAREEENSPGARQRDAERSTGADPQVCTLFIRRMELSTDSPGTSREGPTQPDRDEP